MNKTLAKVLVVVGYALALFAVPLGVAAVNLSTKIDATGKPITVAYDAALPAPPAVDPDRKIAVVLASAYGVEITDFVAPYEVLGQSGGFQVFALAPERKVLPFVNGNMAETTLDLVPHFSFAEYDRLVGRKPDVIAIPWVPDHTPERDAEMIAWIKANAGPDTTLLTICAGTQILAETGLLDGRSATTNIGWFDRLGAEYPTTTWVRGVRWHDDGGIITSTNMASGIDASLHAVDRLLGRAAALETARKIGYRATHYLDDPRWDAPTSVQQVMLTRVAPLAANAALQVGRERMGLLLYDGVSELALGGIIDPYTASLLAKTYAVAPERAVVHTRTGLVLMPRYDAATAPMLDRVLLPGGDAAPAAEAAAAWVRARPGAPVERIHERVGAGESGYDATLRDIAARQGSWVAATIGRTILYAVDDSLLARPSWPVAPIAAALLLVALAVGVVRLGQVLVGRVRAPHTATA